MTSPHVILTAGFGGVWNRAHACLVEAPHHALYGSFIKRLRAFGHEQIFLDARVYPYARMSPASYDEAVRRAEKFISASGLPGAVTAFSGQESPDDHDRLLGRMFVEKLALDNEAIVLSVDQRALFFEDEELRHLASHVPEGKATIVTCGGVLDWEAACAYRFRYEREIRSQAGPCEATTLGGVFGTKSPPLPQSIRFEPCAAFEEVLREITKGDDGRWTRADLTTIYKANPQSFRRHFSHVGIELTNDDNLPGRVRSPRILAPARPVGAMTDATWKKLLADLPRGPLPVSLDLWDFGEPLLHPRTVDWIREAAGEGFRVDLRTNGTRLTPQVVKDLIGSGVDAIFVRIDAANQEGYGKVSGKPELFAEAQAGLARLIQAKKGRPRGADGYQRPILAVEMTEMAETRDEADRFFEMFDHRAAVTKALRNTLGRDPGEGEILDELYKTREPVEYAIFRHDNLYRGRVARPDEHSWAPLHRFPCRQLLEGPYILWDGSIVPCREDIDAEHVLGRVEDGLVQAWSSAAQQRIFEFHDAGCSGQGHFCSSCQEWYYPFS